MQEVGGFLVAGLSILVCRVGEQLYAYRDNCPVSDGSLAGAALRASDNAGGPVLRCPRCRSDFDIVHAGAGLGDPAAHLDPFPLLVRDGVLSVAVPTEPMGAPA